MLRIRKGVVIEAIMHGDEKDKERLCRG